MLVEVLSVVPVAVPVAVVVAEPEGGLLTVPPATAPASTTSARVTVGSLSLVTVKPRSSLAPTARGGEPAAARTVIV